MPRFPDDGRCIGTNVPMVPDEAAGKEVLLAKTVCAGCLVRPECEAAAEKSLLEDRIRQYGVWGGLTDEERDRKRAGCRPRWCDSCGLEFVGPDRAVTCENCWSKAEKTRVVRLYTVDIRILATQHRLPAKQIALRLGLPFDDVADWLRANLKRAERPPRSPQTPTAALPKQPVDRKPRASGARPPAPKPECGTAAARRWHAVQLRRAGKSESLADLQCACKTYPGSNGSSAEKRREVEKNRRNNVDATSQAGQGMAA